MECRNAEFAKSSYTLEMLSLPLELPVCLGRQCLSWLPFPCKTCGLLNDCFDICLTVRKEKIHLLRDTVATQAATSCG